MTGEGMVVERATTVYLESSREAGTIVAKVSILTMQCFLISVQKSWSQQMLVSRNAAFIVPRSLLRG